MSEWEREFMGGTYFIKIKPRCSPETIYVTRLKSHPTGCPENIVEFETFLFLWLPLSSLFNLQAVGLSKEQLCCYFVHFLYFVILFVSSGCVISGCFCGSNCNQNIISYGRCWHCEEYCLTSFYVVYFATYGNFGFFSREDAGSKFFKNSALFYENRWQQII